MLNLQYFNLLYLLTDTFFLLKFLSLISIFLTWNIRFPGEFCLMEKVQKYTEDKVLGEDIPATLIETNVHSSNVT